MSPFEIALIIIGIVCIVASCFFVEHKKEDTVETELGTVTEQILYSQLSDANEKISAHMNQLKEEIIEYTQDEMSRISNEKIMAVHEYSDQVLTDIKKNHEEVLFLYQMLTDKEEELKNSLQQMQQTKREIERFCSMAGEDMEQNQEHIAKTDEAETKETANSKISSKSSGARKKTKTSQSEKSVKNKNLLEITAIDQENHYTKTLQDIENQEFSSHIDEILELSNQGYSIVEISKRLGLGQGEVKLVLDYNKR